jgi:hypothetical protein
MAAISPDAGLLRKRLSGVVAEIAAIGRELDAVISTAAPAPATQEEAEVTNPDERLLAIARRIIKGRELRSRHLRRGLFSDPAWDMLLDLFLARLTGQKVCVSSLCIASRVPATTALRWIKDMEAHGEMVRHADPSDKRRAYIEISDTAFEAVRVTLLASETRRSRRDGSR